MTLIAVADACRYLGIDAKTFHRWLADAQLPLQRHPDDGRKKGLSVEHLRQLADLHHRALWSLPAPQPATPVAAEAAVWPADLLAVPQTLALLQAQIAALQQQVADLTHRLQPPARAAAAAQQALPIKRPATPAPSPSRSPRAASATAKPPRKPVPVLPLVEYVSEGHSVVICPKQGLLACEPDSPAWFAWLATRSSFRFVGKHGRLTAHHESGRVPRGAWRAHRHIRNRSYTLRLAPAQELTIAVLEQAAEALQAHLT